MLTENIKKVLRAPDASYWLKQALRENVNRDPVDALKDALTLYKLLRERADKLLLR